MLEADGCVRRKQAFVKVALMLISQLLLGMAIFAAMPCTPLQRASAYTDYRVGVDDVASGLWKPAVDSLTRAVAGLSSSRICHEDGMLRGLYETQSRIFLGLAADKLGLHSEAIVAWAPLLRASSNRGLLIEANGQLVQGNWNRAFDLYILEVDKNLGGQPGVDSVEVNALLARALSDARSTQFRKASSTLASTSLHGVRYADFIAAVIKIREGRRAEARTLLQRVLTDENLIPSPGAAIIYDYVVQASIDLLSRLPASSHEKRS